MPIRKENCGNVNFLRTRRFVAPNIYQQNINEISFSVLFNTNYEKQDETKLLPFLFSVSFQGKFALLKGKICNNILKPIAMRENI